MLLFISVMSVMTASCAGTKWVIQPESVVDYRDGVLVESYEYIRPLTDPTPRQPVMQYELRTVNVMEYPQRTESQRYVQHYRVRPGLLALSLATSAAVLYVANAPKVATEGGFKNQKTILNSAGGVLALSGLLAMKPHGAPVATEERRMLGITGTVMLRDTVTYIGDAVDEARLTIRYKDQLLTDRAYKEFVKGRMVFDLAREVGDIPVQGVDPGFFELEIQTGETSFRQNVPVTSVLAQYVVVSEETTPLRSAPRHVPQNILTDISQGSRLLYQETYDEDWIKVLYGVATTYVKRSDVQLIWRSMTAESENVIITRHDARFGSVDVETLIPAGITHPDMITVSLNNSAFLTGLPQKQIATDDADIIRRYFTVALGTPDNKLLNIQNPERFDFEELFAFGGRNTGLRTTLQDSSTLFIYINGMGIASRSERKLFLLPSDSRPDDPELIAVPVDQLLSAISRLPFKQCVIFFDTEFNTAEGPLSRDMSENMLREISLDFLNRPNTALIFSALPGQKTGSYISSDRNINNKYSIATYFFVKAIQENRRSINDIFSHLDHNVTFTSRLLHNRPQDPILLGNRDLSIAP